MTKKEIGEILKNLRSNSGLSRKEVAIAIGRTHQIVGHWETGYSQPDADTLFVLCDLYGASVDVAFGFKKTPEEIFAESMDENTVEFFEKYQHLNDEGKVRLMQSLDDLIYSGRYTRNNTTPTEPQPNPEPTEVPLEASSKKRHWAEEMAEEMDVEAETEQYRQRLIEMKKAKERSSVLKSLEKNA